MVKDDNVPYSDKVANEKVKSNSTYAPLCIDITNSLKTLWKASWTKQAKV
jgi:hypothetical protein